MAKSGPKEKAGLDGFDDLLGRMREGRGSGRDLVPSELTAFYRVTCMDISNEHSLVDPEDATTRDTDEEEDEDMVQNQPPPRRLRIPGRADVPRRANDKRRRKSETSAMESTAEKTSNMETADDDQERSQAIEKRRLELWLCGAVLGDRLGMARVFHFFPDFVSHRDSRLAARPFHFLPLTPATERSNKT
ncbi:hypothetical protein CCUS01_01738 [Colletotrichum cuscutae]|uniref:Uncharacterized protein n=1 Tax=Colletotrichum cuscutae TaxID=1209917 RepID=A0AAI9XRT1_9PEZI|nr:hypothetical protein CCUS01_01738 [Colletotrichum cuscutae]